MFQFGGLGALFRGAKHTEAPPWRRDCGGHPGLTVRNLLNYTRIEMKFARLFSFFIIWLLNAQLLRGKRYRLVWAVMINPPEMPTNDESHIASTGVRLQAQVY